MNALTLDAALRIPCITGTGYESDGKLLMSKILLVQYGNKLVSCQQNFAMHICSRELGNKGTGTRLVLRYDDTALQVGPFTAS